MKNQSLFLKWAVLVLLVSLTGQSCRKTEIRYLPASLTVDIPRAEYRHELYYSLDCNERSVELDFSEALDTSTVTGNVTFSDKGGSLNHHCDISSYGRKVFISFKPEFRMKEGWKYAVTLTTGLRSVTGLTFPATTSVRIRTTTGHLLASNDTSTRNVIVCISDIHMGDARAVQLGYCWFSSNQEALEEMLDAVQASPQVRELVILGDLFDGWVVPYRLAPFDTAAGINNVRDYFLSVAGSPVNAGIVGKLKAIAAGGIIRLVYVPGNHDMLLTQEILTGIIPGIVWQGDSQGLGHYSPSPGMVMEHGHRYDFFNCPQPLANPGHILPPGYFISRLDAQGLMDHGTNYSKGTWGREGSLEFLTAWIAAVEYLKFHHSMNLAADSLNIRMGGIDQWPGPFSFNGIRDVYAAGIEDAWSATQVMNAMPVAMPVAMAILDGSMDLGFAAGYEYMQAAAPERYRLVAFGHTHHPMIRVYPDVMQYTGIYANTGSWVNPGLCSKPVRTFLTIKPGAWTGSDLDVVSLFQYNFETGNGNPVPGYAPVLLAEESIERGN
jgi:UDP-2,3-diacylglucosamine pyrophosphatase LpxH